MEQKSITPEVVSQEKWMELHNELLKKEKELMRAHDALAAERRKMPVVEISKHYVFDGTDGKVSLLDLFEGRRQLIVYHFMFAPGVHGWPEAGCVGCSMVIDNLGHISHLHARDTSLVLISLAPLDKILRYKKRMGWDVPWYSSAGSDFNKDFGLSKPEGETFGLSVFLRNGEKIYRSYFTSGRGCENLSTWNLLDLTPFGRQETWEDSPEDWPQTPPYQWWRRHDEY